VRKTPHLYFQEVLQSEKLDMSDVFYLSKSIKRKGGNECKEEGFKLTRKDLAKLHAKARASRAQVEAGPPPPGLAGSATEQPDRATMNSDEDGSYYEACVPKSTEGFMLHFGPTSHNGYSTTILGYQWHRNGEQPFVARYSPIRNFGDVIVAVDGINMQGRSYSEVVETIEFADVYTITLRMLSLRLAATTPPAPQAGETNDCPLCHFP
jgi:hypothetical protein